MSQRHLCLEALEGRWQGISIRSTWDGWRVTTKQGWPQPGGPIMPKPQVTFFVYTGTKLFWMPKWSQHSNSHATSEPSLAGLTLLKHAGSSGAQVARKTTWNRRSLCLGLQNAQKRNWEHWFSWTWNRPLHHSRLQQSNKYLQLKQDKHGSVEPAKFSWLMQRLLAESYFMQYFKFEFTFRHSYIVTSYQFGQLRLTVDVTVPNYSGSFQLIPFFASGKPLLKPLLPDHVPKLISIQQWLTLPSR